MNKLISDLVRVSKRKGFRTWREIADYAAQHAKYDNLTLRDLDKAFEQIPNRSRD